MTEQDALAWIAELFEESVDDLTPDTERDQVPAWDSLGVLTLMASLDNDHELVLTDDEIMAMQSVGDILTVLRAHGKLDG